MKLSLNVDLNGLDKKFQKIANDIRDISPLLNAIGQEIVSITQHRIDRRIPPPNAPLTRKLKQGDHPLKDTGRLYSSINYKVRDNEVVVGTDFKYARVLQYGATISPKNAKSLAIPASRKIMRRYGPSPRDAIEAMKKEGWRIWKSKSGKAILGQKKGGRPQVLFVLKKSVKIPARPFLFVGKEEENAVYQIIESFLRKEF